MFEAIILAGGLGTRLRSVVADVPKPMALVQGKPFLAWQIEYLAKLGVSRVILAVGYRGEIIEQYFQAEYVGVEIAYAHEDHPMGTGGAIRLAGEQVRSDRVFALNGDSLCAIDLGRLRRTVASHASAIGMFVKKVPDVQRYGSVVFDEAVGKVVAFSEKSITGSGFINAGIYDIPRSLILSLPTNESFSFEKEVLQKIDSYEVYAVQAGDFFIDIGIPEDYAKAQATIPAWLNRAEAEITANG